MEQNTIIDTANKYKELAQMLDVFELEQPIDVNAPEEVQAALYKLYYAKALDTEIEKCEDLLEEDTDEETVNAVAEAADAVDHASRSAFEVIEEFYSGDKDFAERVDGVTAGAEEEGIFLKLIKLYKCEAIIKEAGRCSMRFPLYGSKVCSVLQDEEEIAAIEAAQETQKPGIDMNELFELRQRLIKEIGSITGQRADGI